MDTFANPRSLAGEEIDEMDGRAESFPHKEIRDLAPLEELFHSPYWPPFADKLAEMETQAIEDLIRTPGDGIRTRVTTLRQIQDLPNTTAARLAAARADITEQEEPT